VAADVEAEDLVALPLGVGRNVRELDPAGFAAARASAGVVASRPSDVGIPKRRKSSLP